MRVGQREDVLSAEEDGRRAVPAGWGGRFTVIEHSSPYGFAAACRDISLPSPISAAAAA